MEARQPPPDGGLIHVILAGLDGCHELTDDDQRGVAGVVVDVLESDVDTGSRGHIRKHQIVTGGVEGGHEKVEVDGTHLGSEEGVLLLHLFGEDHALVGGSVDFSRLLALFADADRGQKGAEADPGGPEIDRLAKEGDASAIDFPRALEEEGNYEFSFSGLKSAVLNYINSEQMKGHELNKADIAASFQSAVVEVLVHKAFEAIHAAGRDTLVLAGGVAANAALEQQLRARAEQEGIRYLYPSLRLCTDNAAMIACRGAYQAAAGKYSDLYLNAVPGLDFV